ncbi:MAG: hypothetical protein V4850_12510 [Myxococcota bacterium]
MRAITLLLVFSAALLATGCGPDCQTSCEKIFGDAAGECDIQIPGKVGESGRQEMISQCVSHCEQALRRNGDIGDYSPNERAGGDDDISLENEKQAALWMDCVSETSCDNLNKNYCAPVKNYP